MVILNTCTKSDFLVLLTNPHFPVLNIFKKESILIESPPDATMETHQNATLSKPFTPRISLASFGEAGSMLNSLAMFTTILT
jgi:hypothetical protein